MAQSAGVLFSCRGGQRTSQGASHTLQAGVSPGNQAGHHSEQALAGQVLESQAQTSDFRSHRKVWCKGELRNWEGLPRC